MVLQSFVFCHKKKFKLLITKFEYETLDSFNNLYSFFKIQNLTYIEKSNFYYMVNAVVLIYFNLLKLVKYDSIYANFYQIFIIQNY